MLVAPDAFKGTLRAGEVAAAIGRGLERAGLMPPDLCPVSDGGPGTTDVLLPVLGGEIVAARVRREREGRAVTASFALLEDGSTALVEPPSGEPEASPGSSSATGELICAAVDAGAGVILVAEGGSQTRDDGVGALRAIEERGGLGGAQLVILGATRAPSGLAIALSSAHGAVHEHGVPWVLDALDFDRRMRAARAVITGEGTLDFGTLEGRPVGEIGQRTRQAGVPLHAVVGSARLDPFGRRMIDLQRVLEATTRESLEAAGLQLGRELADGRA